MSSDANENPWDRRHILCGGGALVFSAMMASLLGASKPVRAETLTGSVPEVDRLSIRVVVDSYQFAVAAGKKAGPLDIQHFGWGLSSVKPPDRTLVSEFGLSMHAESNRGSETRHLLMDFGFTPEALVNNINLLAIDPADLDTLPQFLVLAARSATCAKIPLSCLPSSWNQTQRRVPSLCTDTTVIFGPPEFS